MNKKQLTEFIPFALFLLSGIGMLLKLPYCTSIAIGSASSLAIIYFNAPPWLYADFSISKINRMIAGYAFSVTMVACMFCLLRWPGAKFYNVLSYVGLILVVIISLFNHKNNDYKQLLYRSIVFLAVLTLIFWYRGF